MTPAKYDVLGIGNAIVDVIATAGDAFIAAEGLTKGTMQLIDAARALDLYGKMGPGVETSGGSAANTMAGIASLGGRAAFVGAVAEDELGRIFRHDLTAAGVHAALVSIGAEPPTARCLILVTPDAERTMNTYLGAAALLGEAKLDPAILTEASVLYFEGYLFSSPENKAAFYHAAKVAKAAGRTVALSLSDRFCVEFHRTEFKTLIRDYVDILFANEPEITALYETGRFDEAARAVASDVEIACLTWGAAGSLIVSGGQAISVSAAPVARVVDTTGAGDLYAAGFLYGYTRGCSLAESGRIAALAAGEIIGHIGPRPEVKLSELLAAAG
jgi:sugar/nucleoside kinase (ribokinase family)